MPSTSQVDQSLSQPHLVLRTLFKTSLVLFPGIFESGQFLGGGKVFKFLKKFYFYF